MADENIVIPNKVKKACGECGKVLVSGAAMKNANAKAGRVVKAFMKTYFELPEEDDDGHEANEKNLIEKLYDIYDPEKEQVEEPKNN